MSRIYSTILHGKHEINSINEKIDLELIDRIFLHFDQPYADSSAIPVYFINKIIANICKVVIGGDGGDELFNGYPSQTLLARFYPLSKYRWLWRNLAEISKIMNA